MSNRLLSAFPAIRPSRVRWTSSVARSAEKLGWSWGYWQFDGDFIVNDMKASNGSSRSVTP